MISDIDNNSNVNDIIKGIAVLKNSYWNNTYKETMKICL